MPFLTDLSLRGGHDVAIVSSCYCSFVHSVLFFSESSLDLCEMQRDFILADYHILFSEDNPMMIKLNAWLVLVQSRLGLSDIPCGESSTEVFANSKCENQIT